MIKLSLRSLTQEAELIILGEVENVRSEWSLDRQLILSLADLHVQEVWKGKILYSKVLIQYPGGRIGELGLAVSDAPSFHKGERVFVFLQAIRNRIHPKNSFTVASNLFPSFTVFGAMQGKYSIGQNGIAIKSGYGLYPNLKEPEGDKVLPFADLKERIRNILNEINKNDQRKYAKTRR